MQSAVIVLIFFLFFFFFFFFFAEVEAFRKPFGYVGKPFESRYVLLFGVIDDWVSL